MKFEKGGGNKYRFRTIIYTPGISLISNLSYDTKKGFFLVLDKNSLNFFADTGTESNLLY
jgi:hypothetical protein